MLDLIAHTLLPAAAIAGAVVMAVTRVIDGATAVALIGSAAGVGAGVVVAADKRRPPPPR